MVVIGSEIVCYTATMLILSKLWYSKYPHSSFHFFNDNNEWFQMDKAGHTTTSYYVGRLGYEALRWAGVSQDKSIWFGGTLGLFFLSSVELFDGKSAEWGYSKGDELANLTGCALFISQQYAWNEQRITLKFSFHLSEYAQYRPNELGNSISQRWLKDYNGQTYWLSANIRSFLGANSKFPEYVNLDFGYAAKGMIGAFSNTWTKNGIDYDFSSIPRYRQFFISPDIDFSRITTNSNLANTALNGFGFFKFPLPAVEYSKQNQFKFHYIYF